MRNISILGSTGSIGMQAIEVCKALNYKVCALAAHSSADMLAQQAKQLLPKVVCIYDERLYENLAAQLKELPIEVVCGMEGLCYAASLDGCDMLLNAVVGMVGLKPTLCAIEKGMTVALANKETLVTGGELVMKAAKQKNVKILPVDSEHSAIFQCIQGNTNCKIKKILLTASGGPFYGKTKDELCGVTVKQALNHPNWSMGAKITIDSATLMNKGLELIEAVHLFNVPPRDIDVVVHRQSVIHSMVEYEDNSILAQLGEPDMRLPIQYALTYPKRVAGTARRLNFTGYPTLTFSKADTETFLCLNAAVTAIERGGIAPTILNGANEKAVELFLNGKLRFLQIGELVQSAMNITKDVPVTLENIVQYDKLAREYVENACSK